MGEPTGGDTEGAAPAPAPAAAPAPEPGAATPGAAPDRDALVQAWGDHILRGLPARAKALYSGGRFVPTEGHRATFALPNAAHCARCEDCRALVEEAISAYFGESVTLELVVDGSPPPAAGPAPAPAAAAPPDGGADHGLAEGDDFDPSEAGDPEAVESMAEARLLEAFPGAEEVTG